MEPRAGCFGFLRWLAFGNLNNGTGNGGLSNLNGNNTLGNANWNILARNSEAQPFSLYAICAAAEIKRQYPGRVGASGPDNPVLFRKAVPFAQDMQRYQHKGPGDRTALGRGLREAPLGAP